MQNEKRLIDIKLTTEEIDDLICGLNTIINDYCCYEHEEEPLRTLIEKLKKAQANCGAKLDGGNDNG